MIRKLAMYKINDVWRKIMHWLHKTLGLIIHSLTSRTSCCHDLEKIFRRNSWFPRDGCFQVLSWHICVWLCNHDITQLSTYFLWCAYCILIQVVHCTTHLAVLNYCTRHCSPVPVCWAHSCGWRRFSNTAALVIPQSKHSTIGNHTSPVMVARVWNSMPPFVSSSPLQPVFKRRLKAELFTLLYPAVEYWTNVSQTCAHHLIFFVTWPWSSTELYVSLMLLVYNNKKGWNINVIIIIIITHKKRLP